MSAHTFSNDTTGQESFHANRLIHTAIPTPGTFEILNRLEQCESRSMHGQLPLAWDRAEDFSVYDFAGNRWIDFTSTILLPMSGTPTPGSAAMNEASLVLSTYAYANSDRLSYIEKLIDFAGALKGIFVICRNRGH